MHDRPRRAVAPIVVAATALSVQPAAAAPFGAPETAALSLFLGALFVAALTSILFLRTRQRLAEAQSAAAAEIAELRSRLDRSEALVATEPQVMIIWRAGAETPELVGDPARLTGMPAGRRLLAFGTWLEPEAARALDARLDALRQRGEPFRLMLRTPEGGHLETEGRPVGAAVVLRLRDVTGERLARAEIEDRNAELSGALARATALLESLTQPVWIRDADGRLTYANEAYARAVEARTGADAVEQGAEFLDQPLRAAAARANQAGQVFRRRAPAVFAGARRIFDVVEAPSPSGSAAIAVDVSELEDVRADLSRQMEAHRRTLDELATAVAIFRKDGALAFHNQSYRQLWTLDPAFLDGGPSDATILDRLRAERRLPEEADFRKWKAELHEAYRAMEPREHWWHLPDGRTLRVVAAPNPEGGVTYLFDDVTEKIALESRFNALSKVQRETLDHLQEAVAVFASDGRLTLHNPAFASLWRLSEADLANRPHADEILKACSARHADVELWRQLKMAMTAMPDERQPVIARIDRDRAGIVDVITLPLPDGGTLATFTDVTASVNVERALRERAEALEAADRLKNDFVNHVSYELRSPLTNIIGFGQLLGDARLGALSPKQREYVEHILSSSAALLAIINDILDLTTIDAGAMELELGPVEVRESIDAAVEGVRDRLAEAGLRLEIDVSPSVGSFVADGKRVRQVLFNLLANAIGFSQPGLPIRLSARREEDAVVFQVSDRGSGIPPEMIEKVFDRFESRTAGARHRGVGLGLSIVRSFVELHGGRVAIDSGLGRGTIVTCRFPAGQIAAAAE
ncbi:signal transduction histidine kinase [Methylopila capsulata]|uniref:histidine kinase n=1 Tax=Methylopila capsulata TaxID=61654 RepID=A0A9W6IXG0_9HYPH|nr:PAS-domain containing protein [Methylopila capsulata]MBM7852830.1 signal transduction histidine kinase [Methylopila capsulata]GLK57039.1 two-component sensor histidine kinase [Methylopila capsulata]